MFEEDDNTNLMSEAFANTTISNNDVQLQLTLQSILAEQWNISERLSQLESKFPPLDRNTCSDDLHEVRKNFNSEATKLSKTTDNLQDQAKVQEPLGSDHSTAFLSAFGPTTSHGCSAAEGGCDVELNSIQEEYNSIKASLDKIILPSN